MKESRRSEVTVVTVVIGRGVIMSEVVTENVTEMVIVVVGTVIVGTVIRNVVSVSVVIVRGMYKVIVVLPCHKVLRTSVTQFSVDQFWVAWWA